MSDETLYSILDVDETASQDDIKQAYKEKAKTHHPDTGGDEEKFKKVALAYAILKDDDKRSRYDAGESEQEPIEVRAVSFVAGEFLSALRTNLLKDSDSDLIELTKVSVYKHAKSAKKMIGKLERTLKQLGKTLEKIENKGDKRNLLETIIEKEIKGLEGEAKTQEDKREMCEIAMKFLENYSYRIERPERIDITIDDPLRRHAYRAFEELFNGKSTIDFGTGG